MSVMEWVKKGSLDLVYVISWFAILLMQTGLPLVI